LIFFVYLDEQSFPLGKGSSTDDEIPICVSCGHFRLNTDSFCVNALIKKTSNKRHLKGGWAWLSCKCQQMSEEAGFEKTKKINFKYLFLLAAMS